MSRQETSIYLVRSTSPDDEGSFLWWSNEFGWVDLPEAVIFTEDEIKGYEPPLGGVFVEFHTAFDCDGI